MSFRARPAARRRARVLLQVVLAFLVGRRGPGLDGAFEQGLGLVRDHQAEVDADDAAEATAGFAGAQRRIEREAAGQRIGVFDIAVGAVQAVAVLPDLGVRPSSSMTCTARWPAPMRSAVSSASITRSRSAPEKRKRSCTTCRMRRASAPALPFRPSSPARRRGNVFLGVHAGVALLLQEAADFFFGEVGWHRDREGHDQARIAGGGRAFGQRVEDRVGRVAPHQLAATPAEQARAARTAASGGRSARSSCRPCCASCAQGWSGRWRWPAGCPRCGSPAACPCDPGTGAHRAKGFHVAALALGVQGVEGQRAFA